MLEKIDHLDGPWWEWKCEIEYDDGTIKQGSIEGDGVLYAIETLELDDE